MSRASKFWGWLAIALLSLVFSAGCGVYHALGGAYSAAAYSVLCVLCNCAWLVVLVKVELLRIETQALWEARHGFLGKGGAS